MKKGGIFCIALGLILIFSFYVAAAGNSVESEIQKFTHYAEEYEAGNINYVQFLLYSSAVRQKLNEVLGATGKEEGGILKEEQIKSVLGEPTEETKWVWVEKEEREAKLNKEVHVWRKIVFDGKKIQIRLSAYPSIFKKDYLSKSNLEQDNAGEKLAESDIADGKYLVYRLNFEIEFKRPQNELDIESKIEEIKGLAESYNSEPSQTNGEALAKESVNIERAFDSYFRQSSEDCEKLMNSIFGPENKREIQKMLVEEIEFYEGDNFQAILRIEMCDDCEWRWGNLNMWIEGRGPGFKPEEEGGFNEGIGENFENVDSAGFKVRTKELVEGMKTSLQNGD